jgi:hypothetical protein
MILPPLKAQFAATHLVLKLLTRPDRLLVDLAAHRDRKHLGAVAHKPAEGLDTLPRGLFTMQNGRVKRKAQRGLALLVTRGRPVGLARK